jgi:hypothetical protein
MNTEFLWRNLLEDQVKDKDITATFGNWSGWYQSTSEVQAPQIQGRASLTYPRRLCAYGFASYIDNGISFVQKYLVITNDVSDSYQ